MLVLIYMDDILLICSSSIAIQSLFTTLHSDFATKDLGPLNIFLGIEVLTCAHGAILSQQRYIMHILKRAKMTEAKPVTSPMATCTHRSAFEGDLIVDPTLYRCTTRALQYLCITRPNISFFVNKLS